MVVSSELWNYYIILYFTFELLQQFIFSNVSNDTCNSIVNESILNPLAKYFCPTNTMNDIFAVNHFPKNLNFVYANLHGLLEACHLCEFVNKISKTYNIISC